MLPPGARRAGVSMKAFATQRLRVRPLCPHDEALYCRLYTDPGTMRHIGAPLSAAAALRNFQKACGLASRPEPAMALWIIDEKDSGAAVGLLARVRHGDVRDMAELGIMLTAEARGRGLAAEALGALVDRLFAQPGTDRLWTSHLPRNLPMVRLMRRLGFSRDDTEGNEAAMWRWSIGRRCWQAGWSAPHPQET